MPKWEPFRSALHRRSPSSDWQRQTEYGKPYFCHVAPPSAVNSTILITH